MLVYVLAISVMALLTLLEMRRGAILDRNRLLNVLNWALKAGIAFTFMRFVPALAPFSLFDLRGLPWAVQFAAFFLAMDLAEYLFHRAQHAIPFLWALHSLHHSDPDMNATTTERHHWADQFIKFVTIYPAVGLLFATDPSAVLAYVLLSLWNYVAHSSLRLNFGILSWAFQSPAYHRRHHSSMPEHFNSNYAALLPIWDVIAGSYNRPAEWPPTGLERKPERVTDLLTWPLKIGNAPRSVESIS